MNSPSKCSIVVIGGKYLKQVDDGTGEMVKYPVRPVNGEMSIIPYDWEILHSFFSNHDIVPVWINCYFTWGSYDEESGKWTGAVGKVGGACLLYLLFRG